MKVGIDISSMNSMSKGRGIGFYTDNLIEALKKHTDIDVKIITEESDISDVDLIHYPFFDFFKPTLKVRHDFPVVVTIHDVIPLLFPKHYPPGIKGRLNLIRQKLALRRVKAIITDSESSTLDVKKIFSLNSNKVFTVYLDCNESFKKVQDKSKIQSTLIKYHLPTSYVLYSGSINWNKNLLNQTKAAIEAGVDIVYIGRGFENKDNLDHPEMKSFKQFVEKYSKNSRVHILGFVPDDDLLNLLCGAKMVLYASFYEGFGLPILEAQSCQVPVITSNVSSMIEVAGEGAILVDPNEEKSIKNAIEKILSNPKMVTDLIEKGLLNTQRFSWEKTAKETVKVYQYALSQK